MVLRKVLFFLFAFAVLAAQPAMAKDAVIKLSRGLVNIVTSPVEYYVQYNLAADGTNPAVGLLGGLIYGTGYTVARIGSGAYDVVTFPIPLPKDYEPLMKPDTGIEAYQAMHGRERTI